MKEIAALEPKPGSSRRRRICPKCSRSMQRQPAKMVIRAAYQSDRASQWIAERAKHHAVALPFTVGGDAAARDLTSLFDDTIARLLEGGAMSCRTA